MAPEDRLDTIPIALTEPLDLRRHLRPTTASFDCVPLLDLIFIACFLVLASSRFVSAPGLMIDLPKSDLGTIAGVTTATVLTVREGELIFFEGRRITMTSLEVHLREFVTTHRERNPALLLKADRSVEIQDILLICEMARRAGFHGVQIAAEPGEKAAGPFLESLR